MLISLVACKHGPHLPPEELPDAMCTAGNNGQTVVVSGILAMPELLFGCSDDCALVIASSSGTHEGMRALLGVGDSPNQVEPVATRGNLASTGAKPTDSSGIHVHPNVGDKRLAVGDPVRVSGQLSMIHDLGRTTCLMNVDTIEAYAGGSHAPTPHVDGMVFVDFDPIFEPKNAILIRRIARNELLASGTPSRFVDRETGHFFFEGSLLRGTLDDPPPWWPDALRDAWAKGIAECRQQPDAPSCGHRLHTPLWDQWLKSQHATRYVYITQWGGESFVPGEPTKRVIELPASTTETREAQLGKLVKLLAHGDGREEQRLDAARPNPSAHDPTDNPLYIGP